MSDQAPLGGGLGLGLRRDLGGDVFLGRSDDPCRASDLYGLNVTGGVLATPPNSRRILPGTTRDAALELATAASMSLEVRRIAVAELQRADEVWISSATRDVLPVTRIDGRPVGSGKPGPQWRKMSAAFERLKAQLKGTPAL